MEVFAVQTYFSSEFLAFFETVLQIRRPVLLGSELVHEGSFTVPPRRSSSLVDANSFSEEALGGEELAAVSGRARGSGTADGARTGSDAGGGAGAGSGASPPLPPGQFDQLRVLSSKYRGERYEVLAEELITRGAMPLGLYRPSGTKGSTLPYTHVNPDVSELLVDGDIVFVLRSRSCPLVGWV